MFHHVTKEELLKKASLLQTLIQATRLRDIEDDKLTETSIGVTLLRHNVDLLKAIEVADQAMYIAKKSGKNKIQFLDMDEY
jgi:PleD family two-component response regulator